MEANSKLKVNRSDDIRHQVHITDVPLSAFKEKRNHYSLKVKKKYKYQKAVIKVALDKSIIKNKQDMNEESVSIGFTDDTIHIFIERESADTLLTKRIGRHRIAYNPIATDNLSIKVKSIFKQTFYKNVLLPRINQMKIKEKHTNHQKQEKGPYTSEDLRRRDFHYADMFPYHNSPNSDGNRSRNEVFGGAFSGISRSGGKRKKRR
ncbi:hypothetical protein GWK91_12810 [Virgibacillus sp. MSP4-1]|uniref:hypothetical protein n=1 Tax=Virgibacillus sp. MSP4-1 TaxID=2700081 RepID=UPI0003AA78A4|nr:hypothetical protein [Virgibacillus sp. MSP4-1]QHS23775.1 hypothetical protein GWK91_12810 [Virgibacillus sp. MSP4-1]